MGCVRFGAPKELVLWLKDTFGVSTFVETGTNKAETSVWAAEHFEQVFTIEGYEPLHRQAVEHYGNVGNIHFLLGDSRTVIREMQSNLEKTAIIWLDAHWCGQETFGKSAECPVLEELRAINETAVEHFVLIDDARYFIAPAPEPHEVEHWPGIGEICEVLAKHPSKRYVVIFEDVIVAVPMWAKQKLINYLRSNARTKPEIIKNTEKSTFITALKKWCGISLGMGLVKQSIRRSVRLFGYEITSRKQAVIEQG
jgi:hypothetical protein